jgi:hypothetical protein
MKRRTQKQPAKNGKVKVPRLVSIPAEVVLSPQSERPRHERGTDRSSFSKKTKIR